jgi:AcrR family transcriptional regulator
MNEVVEGVDVDENARYRRVIRAAEELFKKVGFRAVTMEMVAREANVAKATLYAYFKNKDELFIGVSARMARLIRGAVERALSTDAPLDERLSEAILAKQRLVFQLVRGSPHVNELFSYTHAVAGHVWTDMDEAIMSLLRAALHTDPAYAATADQLARALYKGSGALAQSCETAKDMEIELKSFVSTHLTGSRTLATPVALS